MRMEIIGMALCIALLFGAERSSAEELIYPTQDAPLFTITMPEKWKSDIIEETILQAISPDEKVYMMAWPVDAETIEEAADAIDEFLSDVLTELTMTEKADTPTINGIPFWQNTGSGKDVESDDDVNITADLFSPDGKTVCLLVFLTEPKAGKAHQEEMTTIVHSIKRP